MLFTTIADQIPTTLLAYLDPGSGSMLLQLLIASALSGMFLLKSYYVTIKGSVGRILNKNA
jgi:hypothetical protein